MRKIKRVYFWRKTGPMRNLVGYRRIGSFYAFGFGRFGRIVIHFKTERD